MKLLANAVSVLVLVSFSVSAQTTTAVGDRIQREAQAFRLQDVRLLTEPFKHAMTRDWEYLLRLDADRLLSGFRKEAGLKPKAEVYGGWESMTIAGHSLGHYPSACALMFASTGEARFRERVNYIIAELEECQRANGNGYVAAIPSGKKIFQEVAAGDIRVQPFDLNGGWCRGTHCIIIPKNGSGSQRNFSPRVDYRRPACEVVRAAGARLVRTATMVNRQQLQPRKRDQPTGDVAGRFFRPEEN